MPTSRLITMVVARRIGRQDAVDRRHSPPTPAPPQRHADALHSVRPLLMEAANILRIRGVVTRPCLDEREFLNALADIADHDRTRLTDREQRLCRMALREAHIRLTAEPHNADAAATIARAYHRLGGNPL